jgi:hypothetical protein
MGATRTLSKCVIRSACLRGFIQHQHTAISGETVGQEFSLFQFEEDGTMR